jgi:hypothetical protein
MSRYLIAEVQTEDRVAISRQIERDLVKGKCLSQLLGGPLRRWVGSHIEVDHSTAIMSQHQEHVQDLETDGGNGKKSTETICERWLSRKVRQVRDGGLRPQTMY